MTCCGDGCGAVAVLVHETGVPFCLAHAVDHDAPEAFTDLRTGAALDAEGGAA